MIGWLLVELFESCSFGGLRFVLLLKPGRLDEVELRKAKGVLWLLCVFDSHVDLREGDVWGPDGVDVVKAELLQQGPGPAHVISLVSGHDVDFGGTSEDASFLDFSKGC